jgi:hypothetical protein
MCRVLVNVDLVKYSVRLYAVAYSSSNTTTTNTTTTTKWHPFAMWRHNILPPK